MAKVAKAPEKPPMCSRLGCPNEATWKVKGSVSIFLCDSCVKLTQFENKVEVLQLVGPTEFKSKEV